MIAFQQGNYEEALELFHRYRETGRQLGRVWFEVEAVCLLGSVYLEISPEHLEQILALHDEAEGLMQQSMLKEQQQDLALALVHCSQALGENLLFQILVTLQ